MLRTKLAILLVCISCSSGSVFSQKIFREGYIIKNSGERFDGLVGFSPDKKIPSKCLFKRFEIAEVITYTAENLSAFGYHNGKRFESIEREGKRSFYEALVYGDLKLFSNGSDYLIQKSGYPAIGLDQKPISWKDDSGEKSFNSPEELMAFLAEDTPLSKNVKFNLKDDIIPVVSAYNNKAGKSYVVFNRTYSERDLSTQAWRSGVNRNRFGIIAGINIYNLNLSAGNNMYLPQPESETAPSFGVSFERVISRTSDRTSVRAELLYLEQNFYSYKERIYSDGRFEKNDALFDFSAVKIPVLFQYTFVGNRFKPFINGGGTYTMFLKRNYFHIHEVESYYHSILINEDNDFVFKKSEISLSAGIGLKIRITNNIDFLVEGRIGIGSGFFDTKANPASPFKQSSYQPGIIAGINF